MRRGSSTLSEVPLNWSPDLHAFSESTRRWDRDRVARAIRVFSDQNAKDFDAHLARRLAWIEKIDWQGPLDQEERIRVHRHGTGVMMPARQNIQSLAPKTLMILDNDGRPLANQPQVGYVDRLLWLSTDVLRGRVRADRIDEVRWFLDHMRRAVDFQEAQFAFSTTSYALSREGHAEPKKYAWPVMVLGGDLLARLGEEAVIRSSAHLVLELPNHRYWVEVAAHPFLVTQEELDKFAGDLGLKPSVAPREIVRIGEGPDQIA